MIDSKFLEFEKPIAEIEARLEELKYIDDSKENIKRERMRLLKENKAITENIYKKLSDWQVAQISRHPMRPYSLDYVSHIFKDFVELHGDRMFSDDTAIIGGIGRLDDIPVLMIGHQKGRDTKERVRRNYGMPKPEGYRKSLRLMKLAEKFNLPIISFIDTPGAYPGLGAEERGQSEAIAKNLLEMSKISTPIISILLLNSFNTLIPNNPVPHPKSNTLNFLFPTLFTDSFFIHKLKKNFAKFLGPKYPILST